MPAKSLYRSSSMLFDIDENEDAIVPNHRQQQPPQPHAPGMLRSHDSVKRVSIQAAPVVHHDGAAFEISQDDPVLGDGVDFHRQSSTTARARHHSVYQGRGRARSRRHSVTPWPICGLTMPVLVLRGLTSLVVIPLILGGLIWIPHVAVVWLCVLLVCLCSYEYSWLAFRIHYQLLSTYSWYERAPSEEETQDADETEPYHFQSFVSGFSGVSGSLASSSFGPFSVHAESNLDEDGEEDHTIGGEGGMAARAAKMVASPLDTLEFAVVATAVSGLADKWCGGREWIAKLMVTAVFTPLWILVMHYIVQGIDFPVALGDVPGSVVFDLPELTWIAIAVAFLLALSTPNLRFAVSMLIQVNAFFAIVVNSLACPILSIHKCTEPLLSATEVFAFGAVSVLALRGLTSTSPADMVIVTMVDLLGYLFVVGGFSLVVGVVDVHHDKDKLFARVLLLLVVVLWTAQVAGYACDRLISHLQLSRFRLLPRRIAVRVDLESSVCAICVGVLATAVGGPLVALPTPLYINVAFAFAAVLLARLGALFMSLLRRAAGVRRSSRVLPGFGGMLDMASVILFAAVAFSKLYTVAMVESERVARGAAALEERMDTLSVDFTGLQ